MTVVAPPIEKGIEMEELKLDFLFKDRNSGSGGCPAVYKTDRDSYVIQGWVLPAGTQLRDQAANETGVEVPSNIFDQMGRRWAAENGLL
jgi:hypothetical protein